MKGSIRKRGEKSWQIRLYVGLDLRGRPRYRAYTVHGTKRDAERERIKLVNEVITGSDVDPSRITVGEYLERWLTDYARANVSAKTYERYAEIVRKHLIPALGKHLVQKLRPLDIQSYYSRALETGRLNGKGGLSAQTVVHHHTLLHKALEDAVHWQMLSRNPADSANPPRVEGREMRVLTPREVRVLLCAARGTTYFIPAVLAITTGVRRGEILALRWEDVDLDNGCLYVRRSLEQTRSGLTFKEPKTASGRRQIALPQMTVDALREHRAEQNKTKEIMGEAYSDEGLVCARPDGSPTPPDHISDHFRRLTVRAGLGRLRFHDLRHAHATLMLMNGENPKVVQERLGHSTISITLNTYTHVLPTIQESAAKRLNDLIMDAPLPE